MSDEKEVLLDNCIPRKIGFGLGEGIKATEARKVGLGEVSNSELEWQAYKRGYDSLLTIDTDLGKPDHIPEYHLPVVLLRAHPTAVQGTLAVLIPKAAGTLLSAPDIGLHIWDNYKGKIFYARSLKENSEQRKKQDKKLKEREKAEKARLEAKRSEVPPPV